MASEIDDAQALMVKALETIKSSTDLKFEELEKLFDRQEQQLAMLSQAYVELAAIIESVTSLVINRSEEDKKEFFETLSLSRKKMMETLQHGITLAEQNADRFVAHAPGSVSESKDNQADDNS